MAKLPITVLSALFAVTLFLATTTSAYRTTITTVEIDEKNPWRSQRQCQQQVSGEQLRSCQYYLSSQQGRRYLGMRGIDDENQGQLHLQECCQQLSRVNEQCRCEGLRQAVRQQQQQGRFQGRDARQMLQSARTLTSLCRLSPQQCEMQT